MSQPVDNPFGLRLDGESVIKKAPLVIVYGPPKLGKSEDAAISFSDAMWMCSDAKVLRAYATWYHQTDDKGRRIHEEYIRQHKLRDPEVPWEKGGMARISIPEYKSNMRDRTGALFNLYSFIQDKYAPAVEKGAWPTRGLVLDEASEFVRRGLKEIEEDPDCVASNGNTDSFEVHRRFSNFMAFLAQVCSATKQPVILLANEKAPSYNERKNHRDFGKLKYKGGPDFQRGGIARTMCHAADVIVHRTLIETAQEDTLRDKDNEKANNVSFRAEYITTPSETWERGVRDVRVQPRFGLSLREFLTECGFVLS